MEVLLPLRSYGDDDLEESEDVMGKGSQSMSEVPKPRISVVKTGSSRATHKQERRYIRSMSMQQDGFDTNFPNPMSDSLEDIPIVERSRSLEETLGARTTFRCRLGLCNNDLEVLQKQDSTILNQLTRMVRVVQELTDHVGSCLPPEVAAELSESFRARLNFPIGSVRTQMSSTDYNPIVVGEIISVCPQPPSHLKPGHDQLLQVITQHAGSGDQTPSPELSDNGRHTPGRQSAATLQSRMSSSSLEMDDVAKRKRSLFGGTRENPRPRSTQSSTPDSSSKDSRSLMSKFFRRSSNSSNKGDASSTSPLPGVEARGSCDSIGLGTQQHRTRVGSLEQANSLGLYSLSPKDSVPLNISNTSQTSTRSGSGVASILMKLPAFGNQERGTTGSWSSGSRQNSRRLQRTGSDHSSLPAVNVDEMVTLSGMLNDQPQDAKRSSSFSSKKNSKPVVHKFLGSDANRRKRAGTTPSSMRSMQQRVKAKIKADALNGQETSPVTL